MALTGYAHENLARQAVKVMVDIDEAEIRKMRTAVHLPVVADAGAFFRQLNAQLEGAAMPRYDAWVRRCEDWKERYPIVQPEYRQQTDGVSTYCLAEAVSTELTGQDVVVSGSSGSGSSCSSLRFRSSGAASASSTRAVLARWASGCQRASARASARVGGERSASRATAASI